MVLAGVRPIGRLTGISCFSLSRKARYIQFILLPVPNFRLNHSRQPLIYECIQVMQHRNEVIKQRQIFEWKQNGEGLLRTVAKPSHTSQHPETRCHRFTTGPLVDAYTSSSAIYFPATFHLERNACDQAIKRLYLTLV